MNKTVNINLGGWFFHIDEDAYEKLSVYLQAVKRSLQDPDSQDEIMKDIELRMAELLSASGSNGNQVVNSAQVDELIRIMGEPEVYSIDSEEQASSTNNEPKYTAKVKRTRKLYRDPDKTMLAGVCSGLGHYFGIDPVWLRILFLGSVLFSFGSMFLVYIILWICVPEAKTTADKLEMTGTPVNISNIEKKVKEEFNNVSDRIKNVDYNKFNQDVTDGVNRGIKTAGESIKKASSGLGKLFGAIVVTISSFLLAGMIIGWVVLTKLGYEGNWNEAIYPENHTEMPLWALQLIAFVIGFIPLLVIWIWGLRKLNPHFKPVHASIKWAIGLIWAAAILACIYLGVRQGAEYTSDNQVITRHELPISSSDTLRIHWNHHPQFANSTQEYHTYKIASVDDSNDILFSNRVRVTFKTAAQGEAYLQVERYAEGTNLKTSLKRAEKITYDWKLENNQLHLNNYFTTPLDARFADQLVQIYIYLPKGTVFTADYDLEDHNHSYDYFTLTRDAKYYRVDDFKIESKGATEAEWQGADQMPSQPAQALIQPEQAQPNQPNAPTTPESTKPLQKGDLMLGPDGTLIKKTT